METWIIKVFQAALEWNGYNGYEVHIELKRPSIDRSAERREQVKLAIEGKAITIDEIRDNLPELELREMSDEVRAELSELYKATSPVMTFGNVTPGFTKKEDKEIVNIEDEYLNIDTKLMEKVLGLLSK